jgi:hypothetical protein
VETGVARRLWAIKLLIAVGKADKVRLGLLKPSWIKRKEFAQIFSRVFS